MALHALDWQPSPMAGVERRLLDRNGAEIAQATVAANTAPIQLAAGSWLRNWVKTGHLPVTVGPQD